MDTINPLVHLAWQFGPFAFSLIFLIGLAAWGSRKWQEVMKQAEPPATEAERNTYRQYFIWMTVIGVVLVGLSVYWWWNHRPIYFYEGQIEQVSETDSIEGGSVFVRNEYYKQDPTSPQFRDVHFLIKQTEPFTDGQEINLRYFRDRRLHKPVLLKVALDGRYSMGLEYDATKDEWQLRKRARVSTTSASLIREAVAQVIQRVTPVAAPKIEFQVPALVKSAVGGNEPFVDLPSVKLEHQAYVKELQDSRTLVSRKVEILDELKTASQLDLRELFQARMAVSEPLKEPVFITLMDLSRHTDKEIASKAKALLVRAPLPTNYFYAAAASKDRARQSAALNQFLRLERDYAVAILSDLSTKKVDVTAYRQVAREGEHWKAIVPTGTSTGDRYYMKVEWNAKTYQCVYGNLASLANPQGVKSWNPSSTSPWVVFDPEKTLILKAYDDVSRCGGKATFVGFYPQSRK